MAQRQATSTNDNLTIAGLLVLGLTSALVGALVVAPTLAPKRMALAMELPDAPSAPAPKQSLDPKLTASILDAVSNAPGNGPRGNGPEATSSMANGPEEEISDSPVTIRKPGELVGPPIPPGLGRSNSTDAAELQIKPALDRRERSSETILAPDNGNAKPEEEEPKTSARRAPVTAPIPEPEKPESEDGNEPNPDEDDVGKKRTGSSRVYRVQSGKFNTREEAEKVKLELAKSGTHAVIQPAGDGVRLQLGVFQSRENAEKAADKARGQSIIVDVRSERQAPRRGLSE